MNAIVIVFIPRIARDRKSYNEKPFAVATIDNSSRNFVSNTPATTDSFVRDHSTAPFWTWFIENPRSYHA
jgi:hypothetical protein